MMNAAMSLTQVLDEIRIDRPECAKAQQSLRLQLQKSDVYRDLIKQAYISGSYARGTAVKSKKTDVDLVFLLKEDPKDNQCSREYEARCGPPQAQDETQKHVLWSRVVWY